MIGLVCVKRGNNGIDGVVQWDNNGVDVVVQYDTGGCLLFTLPRCDRYLVVTCLRTASPAPPSCKCAVPTLIYNT